MTATIPQILEHARQRHQAGRLAEAEALYRRILAAEPNHADARQLLGVIAHQAGRNDLAVQWISQAIALDPQNACAHSNLGAVLTGLNEFDAAIASCRRALVLKPDYPEAHNNLGNALRARGDLAEAMAACRRALALHPNYAEAHSNLGAALAELDRLDESLAACRQALAIKPDYPEALVNLGAALKGLGRLDEAISAYRRALEINPDLPEAHNDLGIASARVGRLDEALAAYRRAVELAPKRAGMHSNLIYGLHFHPDRQQETIVEEQHRWNRQFSDPLQSTILPHPNVRDPERRLRIGYLSPDFHDHAVAFFLTPLLEAHDHERFEIYGYSSLSRPDAITARLQLSADHWREVRSLSDAQLAECIRQDGIDILIDLAMHAAGNRLPALAHRPAPVQVSWLGYPGSTGLEAIGWRISDGRIDPVGSDESSVREQVVRLPDVWCCYAPCAEFPPVSPLPAADGRGVTFGSLNQFAKINEALLASWATILRVLPDARLIMICPAGQAQERTLRQFTERGVAPERIEPVTPGPWEKYVRLSERIDVALDSYPCNGMTTTCHALWMGLPTVTRAGESAVSRASLSLLHTLRLQEWVAPSDEEYVRIAVELAADLARLAELRATLRARMTASPLMDAPRFTRNMEAAYRTLWRQRCASATP